MLDRALALGFDAVVTGHHARLVDGRLRRSVDAGQGPVLRARRAAPPSQLAHAMFPLGDIDQGRGARRGGARAGSPSPTSPTRTTSASSPTATPAASSPGGSGAADGPIVDAESGDVVGTHAGSFGFTVGQRRGLDLTRPAPGGEPRYVLSIRPADNTVVVGPRELLEADVVPPAPAVWTCGAAPGERFDCPVQLRAHGMTSPATVDASDGDEVRAGSTCRRPASRPARRWSCTTATPSSARPPSPPPSAPPSARDASLAAGRGHRHRVAARHRPGRGGARSSSASCPTCRTCPSCPPAAPARDMIGRGAALLVDLPVEIAPSGWRLTAHPGRDLRRAPRPLARDLDALEDAGRGLRRPAQAAGGRPVDARRGARAADRAPGRHRPRRGARPRRVAGRGAAAAPRRGRAPAAGRRPRPAARRAVAAGRARRAGADAVGLRHGARRRGRRGRARRCRDVLAVAPDGGRVVHCCAPDVPIALLRAAGADAIALDAPSLTTRALRRARRGRRRRALALARRPARHRRRGHPRHRARPDPRGSGPRSASRRPCSPSTVVPTPACGLAGATPAYARRVLRLLRDTGAALLDQSD